MCNPWGLTSVSSRISTVCILVAEEEFFVDLLFYHRGLRCLIAIELKRGKFKPAYLGQLNFYLSALDEQLKHQDENQSIGLLLCQEANKTIVELAVRDYNKLQQHDLRIPRRRQ